MDNMKVGEGVRVPGNHCLKCKKLVDGNSAVNAGNTRTPRPDDVLVCIYCGHLMAFGVHLQVREVTAEERAVVERDPAFIAVQKARQAMAGGEPCRRDGCTAPATCVPKVNVPSRGAAVGSRCCGLLVTLPLCDKHLQEFKPDSFLRPENLPVLESIIASRGWKDPDFANARVVGAPLDDKEYLALKDAREKRRLLYAEPAGHA